MGLDFGEHFTLRLASISIQFEICEQNDMILPWPPIKNLPQRLERQAINVEDAGWITAARLMREAAAEIEEYRAMADKEKGPEGP
jgi:hypothetical protein